MIAAKQALPRLKPPRSPDSITCGPHGRPGSRLARIPGIALAVAAVVSGCGYFEASLWSFRASNASDATVIVNSDSGGTFTVPPHSYTEVAGGRGDMGGGWQIELVDADCHPLVALTVSDHDRWLYIPPDGQASLSEPASLAGQAEVSKGAPPSVCPRPRER